MKRTTGRSILPLLVALSLVPAARTLAAASGNPAAPASAAAPVLTGRDAELSRRLDDLLTASETVSTWKVSIDYLGEKDRRVHKIRLWADGVGIWDDESQFRLKPAERLAVLKAFRDHGFCGINDELVKEGSGRRKSPNGMLQEQSVTLAIGKVTKTVTHVVSTFGVFADVEEAARPLVALVSAVRKTCEGPAKKGVRAKDLADGLAKVADGRLPDVALRVSVSSPLEAGGGGWMTRLEGRDVTASVATKGKGWSEPASLRLSVEELRELVRQVAAAKPGTFPQNIHDEGYTDFTVAVLDRSVIVQARPFASLDPMKQGAVRAGSRAVLAAVRKVHDRALAEAAKP